MSEMKLKVRKVPLTKITMTLIGVTPLLIDRPPMDGEEKPKCDEDVFKAGMYIDPEVGYSIPAAMITTAFREACSSDKGVGTKKMTKVEAGQCIRVVSATTNGNIKIIMPDGEKPIPFINMVPVPSGRGKGGARVRKIRPQFKNWSIRFTCISNTDVASPTKVIEMFQLAGFAVGFGSWRVSKPGGTFGQFRVDLNSIEIEESK